MSYNIERISSPHQSGRGIYKPELIVYHIADGTYAGTKSWFLNPASQISSNYILGQEGQICECVPIDKMAWCNGTTTSPGDSRYYGHSTVSLVRQKGGNANQYSVSIECEGYYAKTGGALTEKQLDALVWLTQRIQTDVKAKYGAAIPFDQAHLVGHYEVNPKTKLNCPGGKFQWEELMKRLGSSAGTLYRVQCGAFAIRSGADTLISKLQAKGHDRPHHGRRAMKQPHCQKLAAGRLFYDLRRSFNASCVTFERLIPALPASVSIHSGKLIVRRTALLLRIFALTSETN